MVKVSIILPSYNVANYIEKSIRSIINQTFTDFEVIIVNDGSTDNIIEVINNLKLDSRFKLFTKKNEGSGFARNYGFEKSVGKYIYFMDPDDTIDGKLLEDNVRILETTECDFTIFGYEEISVKNNKQKKYKTEKKKHVSNSIEVQKELLNIAQNNSIVAVWNKVFRKSFLLKNKLEFTNLPIGQDAEFSWKVYKKTNEFISIPETYYNYSVSRPGSARTKYNEKKYSSELKVLNQMIDTISDWELADKYTSLINKQKVNIIISEIINIKKDEKQKLKSIKKRELFKEITKFKLTSVSGIKDKIKLVIIKIIDIII
ncbi:glycosyltransferase family 2 protein [Aerococcus urinaeequi]|uniref:glycosyltransferase family 2 protein n=1 Tax=Aerococcus urinaeequi TaxID=51665 RepID=UPI003AB09931